MRIVSLEDSKEVVILPTSLQWISGLVRKEDATVEIGRKAYHYLGLCYTAAQHSKEGFMLDLASNAPYFGSKRKGYTSKRSAIEIMISGDFEPTVSTVVVDQDRDTSFEKSLKIKILKGNIQQNFGV